MMNRGSKKAEEKEIGTSGHGGKLRRERGSCEDREEVAKIGRNHMNQKQDKEEGEQGIEGRWRR